MVDSSPVCFAIPVRILFVEAIVDRSLSRYCRRDIASGNTSSGTGSRRSGAANNNSYRTGFERTARYACHAKQKYIRLVDDNYCIRRRYRRLLEPSTCTGTNKRSRITLWSNGRARPFNITHRRSIQIYY